MEREGLADNEWRTGWPVVLASLAGFTLISFYTFSFGAFIAPIEQETGWSRAQISIGLSVITISAGILTPVLGWVVDRFGPRRVALPGAVAYALTYGLLGLTDADNIWTWWGIWFLLSFTVIGIKPLVWTTAVASTFQRNRGLALAIALCGGGLTSAFAPSLSTWAIDQFGWRGAYPFLALSMSAVVIPILFFGLHSGADKAKRAQAGEAPPEEARALYGLHWKEAMATRKFVMLAAAAFVFTLAAIGIIPNLMPILVSFDFGRTEAAAIAGVAGVSSIIGRLITGWLLDRFNPNVVAGTVVLIPVASCLLLIAAPGSTAIAILTVAIIGVSLGSEVDVMAFMCARQFGTVSYGVIFGVVSGLWAIATGTGPTVANRIYDVTGGYELALELAIPCFVVTSLLLFFLGKPPDFADAQAEPSA